MSDGPVQTTGESSVAPVERATLASNEAAFPPANLGAPHPDDDARSELLLALVLRGGVLSAASLLGAALAISLLFGLPIHGGGGSLQDLWQGHTPGLQSLAQLGILALALTPVARVALSIPIFARAGERKQALIGLGVLLLLALSMLLGKAEG